MPTRPLYATIIWMPAACPGAFAGDHRPFALHTAATAINTPASHLTVLSALFSPVRAATPEKKEQSGEEEKDGTTGAAASRSPSAGRRRRSPRAAVHWDDDREDEEADAMNRTEIDATPSTAPEVYCLDVRLLRVHLPRRQLERRVPAASKP